MSTEKFKVVVTRRFQQPPEQVFDAWLDPVSAAKWLFSTPNGEMLRAEIDPSVGGEFCIVERREDEVMEHLGEYTELDRPRRLAFIFTVNLSDDVSDVTIDIAPAAGGADLTLTHAMGSQWASFADRTAKGWDMILDGLAETLA